MELADRPVSNPAPIEKDIDGVFRVGGTRVRLETLITSFQDGCTAEEIHYKYPSLELADIYSTIAYHLQNRETVELYIGERRSAIEATERDIANRSPTSEIRERLLARRKAAA